MKYEELPALSTHFLSLLHRKDNNFVQKNLSMQTHMERNKNGY